MSEATPLAAEIRERAGKGAARATRRAGRIPAVIYGAKKESVMISLEPVALQKQLSKQGFFTRVFDVTAGGNTEMCLARDVQFDPVTDRPLHVDFMRLKKGQTINVEVAVDFINDAKCPGLKKGGVLNIVRHTVELLCDPTTIPEVITVDLATADVGDSIHISAVELPEGVTPSITDRDFTIATIAAPSTMEVADDSEEEGDGEEEATEE
ncbi:MAG: 50S ribosomal protein L25/general stress protein Ctc [Magnetovibrionaceae bacterium]